MIRAMAIDMDGVITDTERLSWDAWESAARHFGFSIPQEVQKKMVGLYIADIYALVHRAAGPFDIAAVEAFRDVYVEEAVRTAGVPLRPGARELLQFCRERGVRVALATSSEHSRVDFFFARCGLWPYFDAWVTRDDVLHPKPDPEIYALAAERLGAAPSECMGVDDSASGILSAHRAGLLPVLVPDQAVPTADIRALCHRECRDLFGVIELLSEQVGS